MIKRIVCLLALSTLVATPVFAGPLFINGGFEEGTFNGWTLTGGNVQANTASPNWGGYYPYYEPTNRVFDATWDTPYVVPDINPYNGTYMARINDEVGYYHATMISQTATIAADNLTDTLYVNWGAVLEDPSHPAVDQPFFSIQVLKNGSPLDTFTINATGASIPGSGWANVGTGWGSDPLYYKTGQYTYNLGVGFGVGDQITITMYVTDCGQSGHAGWAYLDGIGTTYEPPPNGVPEPASSLLLLGMGLGATGLAAWRSKK